ncbi:clamp loader of DNA polymerase [Serratia phage vB_SmaA_3M]|uniref:Sliding-clamp-loader large subunit n=1 Tax=Serratia phage vB_SmaA_3M TaxID=2419930 RepID=A0A3G2YS64_9CAUD|nr:clamp loader of DNA polymerase [Serratia phage vB_SmaA_3M]AYP28338.1 putative clamp loader subunit DNA polymerase accessory protein [Serratia phage vB_SmaA_3M]
MSDITIQTDQYAWENKYRPGKISEIILPRNVRSEIEGFIADGKGKIPSFLFYSPSPGTGKTTTALALCNDIGCKKPLFINASLHTSIDTIRDLVTQYATGASVFGGRKVVILDEVERLSTAAQESLKGLVEMVSAICSFVLTTNAKQRVVEPLRSRCREIDFIWTSEEAMEVQSQFLRRCTEILNLEGVPFEIPVLASIVKRHFPDNRKILGILQKNAVTFKTVDQRALVQLKSGDLAVVATLLKENKWGDMKQWVTDNQNYLTEDLYSKFFKLCVPDDPEKPKLVENGCIPTLVFVCGDAQAKHRMVGDLWLHAVYFFTNVMLELEGKWR